MSLYTIAVFLHVVGALGLFAALGLEWAGLRGVRRSVTIDHVRQWIWLLGSLRRLTGPSALTILVTGIYGVPRHGGASLGSGSAWWDWH